MDRNGYSRRDAIAIFTALGLGATTGTTVAKGDSDENSHESEPTLNRLATSIIGSECTGLFITREGRFFFNVQHPNSDLKGSDDAGIVGALTGVNINDLPEDFGSVQIPASDDFDYSEMGDGIPETYDKMVQTAFGSYQPLMEGGADIGNGEELGIPLTPDGEIADAEEYITSKVDFNGYVPAESNGPKNGHHEGFLFTNWETRPGMVSRMHIASRNYGPWQVLGVENLNFRDVKGTYNNCFGTVSPWDTPLTSEENYEVPTTDQWNNPESDTAAEAINMARYLGHEPNANGIYDEQYPNPFRYGYIVEIQQPTSADPQPVKHFTLGRATHENAVVMPDQKTAYTTSDGTGEAFFKFIADEAGDLSAGTLYAAKAEQKGRDLIGRAGGEVADISFGLEWIELGHANNDQIESWITEYDDVTQTDYTEGETSYISDTEIEQWANGNASDDRVAFLESTRAAGAVGATDEFRKMEGINIRRNAEIGDHAYVAMSETSQTMLSNQRTTEENRDEEDEIRLQGDEWGAVYQMQLYGKGQTYDGRKASHDYEIMDMKPVVVGGPDANICGGCPYDARPDSASSVCQDCSFNPTNENEEGVVGKGMQRIRTVFSSQFDPTTTIANPDNIVVMDDGRVIIGEDSSLIGHENNMIWVYNPGVQA